jgi:glyoxylase-like metal-dependent hydrolase (beta-lactamase superfamily II)
MTATATSIATASESQSKLRYPCGEPPAPGHAKEIAPGVLWARIPLPYKLDHVNIWAVRDGDGWAIVDTGVKTLDSATAWANLLAPESPMAGGKVTRVLVTHMHPDHVGMAGWLTRRFDCRMWMTRLEYLNCRMLAADCGREAPEAGIRFYQHAGWTPEQIETYRARFGNFGKTLHPLPDSYRRLRDGEELTIGAHEWRVVVGTGHSPEHACYYCPELKLLISGDQVLPKISSNVSVYPTEPDANPLGDWLASIAKIKREVPDDVLVLPAHNEPFHGLHARLDYLAAGHEKGLARLRALLAEPQRAVDVFGALFSRSTGDAHFLSLATGESLSHLNYLVARGEASVTTKDGVAMYQLVGA